MSDSKKSIEEFIEDLNWSKSRLAEELGYSSRQALTYIDQRKSSGFIVRMYERFPRYRTAYNADMERHEIEQLPIDFNENED